MAIVHAQITKHGVYTTDKNKNPLLNKRGQPYARVAIKTDVYGDRWLSAFSNFPDDEIRSWSVGEFHDILVEERNGYLNFSVPDEEDMKLELVENHDKLIAELIRDMRIVKKNAPQWFAVVNQTGSLNRPVNDIPEIPDVQANIDEEIRPEDLPF